MISNLLKVIFRFFLRNRFFTLLNIAGLSIGLGSCFVVYLFVHHEMSYDRFHRDGDRIYRVIRQSQMNGEPYDIGVTSAPFAEALVQDYESQIDDATRTFSFSSLVQHGDKSFIEERLLLADSNFFSFFSFPLLKGDPNTALRGPNSLVVSKAFARKYFGDSDPLGKTLRLDNEYDMIIAGVMDEVPGYTHLQFDAVGSLSMILSEEWVHEWWNNAMGTYVRVDDNASVTFLNSDFPNFMEKYFGRDFQRVGNRIGLKLEPLQEIYFNFGTRYERNVEHGDRRYTYIFTTAALLILILAVINYINLATAQAAERSREVGIRKTLGSERKQIATRFIAESLMLCLLAGVVAAAIAQAAVPALNGSIGLSLPTISEVPQLVGYGLILVFLVAVVAGAYPAFVLSSFSPHKVLKGIVKGSADFLLLRKVLITFQFAISGVMIIAAIFIGRQLRFMQEKDLGFSREQVVLLPLNNEVANRGQLLLKQKLEASRGIESVSTASGNPGGYHDASTVAVEGQELNSRMRTLFADASYADALGLTMVAGRFFDVEIAADTATAVVLNETAVKSLGWTNDQAIGKRVQLSMFDSTFREVTGVVKDFHFTSLKETIEPLIITCRARNNILVIRSAGTPSAMLAVIEEAWASMDSGYPAAPRFLNDVLQRLYTSEQAQGRVFSMLSAISILIASLGIFGLASYLSVQRRKEVGIRKILGGGVADIGFLLVRDLLVLVIVAMVIAVPVCYWALERWSQTFAYRVSPTMDIFLIGAGSVTILAFIIVSYNGLRAAMENPVNSIRNE